MTPRIQELYAAYKAAEKALLDGMAVEYPIGSKVVYTLRPGITGKVGTVLGHIPAVDVKVRLRYQAPVRHYGDDTPYEQNLPITKIVKQHDGDSRT